MPKLTRWQRKPNESYADYCERTRGLRQCANVQCNEDRTCEVCDCCATHCTPNYDEFCLAQYQNERMNQPKPCV